MTIQNRRAGHMLARLEGERGLTFAQVPFVDYRFIEAFVRVTREEGIERRMPARVGL